MKVNTANFFNAVQFMATLAIMFFVAMIMIKVDSLEIPEKVEIPTEQLEKLEELIDGIDLYLVAIDQINGAAIQSILLNEHMSNYLPVFEKQLDEMRGLIESYGESISD